ncbi:MAG: FliM/FliN family flagellar motor switch protein [Pseudomonadota bacterium]
MNDKSKSALSGAIGGLSGTLCHLKPEAIAVARQAAQRLVNAGYSVRLAPVRERDQPWYVGEHLAFLPPLQTLPKGISAEELMRVLSEHEDVLSNVERALGLAGEFADYRTLPRDLPTLKVDREGEALMRLAILHDEPLSEIDCPPTADARGVVTKLAFIAARLPLLEAEALTGGDMLVLNHGPWPFDTGLQGAVSRIQTLVAPLGFDPGSGALVPLLSNSGVAGPMSSSESPQPHSGEGLSVPVAIHLGDALISQKDLEQLAQTGTFDLGAVSEGLSAQLSVGGRSIGRGEIVRIGDRFAVLLDHVETHSETPPEGTTSEDVEAQDDD